MNPEKEEKDIKIMGKYAERNHYKNIFARMEENIKETQEKDEDFEDIVDEEKA